MKEYNFYEYCESEDKIKIYSEDIQKYFKINYNIIVNSVDFDQYQNVILYIEDAKNKIVNSDLEKILLGKIDHLNNVIVKNMKIILTFDCKDIVLY